MPRNRSVWECMASNLIHLCMMWLRNWILAPPTHPPTPPNPSSKLSYRKVVSFFCVLFALSVSVVCGNNYELGNLYTSCMHMCTVIGMYILLYMYMYMYSTCRSNLHVHVHAHVHVGIHSWTTWAGGYREGSHETNKLFMWLCLLLN